MPHWFRIFFAVVMLGVCAVLAWCACDGDALRFQLTDVAGMLDTSRQRELKQQYEYDQAAAALPEVMAQVAELAPQADAAKAAEAELRAQRKQLRADNEALTVQLDEISAALVQAQADLSALKADLSGLIDDAAALTRDADTTLNGLTCPLR